MTGVLDTTKGDGTESPPGAGFVATMFSVVAAAIRVAGKSTSNVEALIKVVFSGVTEPATFAVVPLKKPVPRTVVVSRLDPTFAAEGHTLVMVGVAAFTNSESEMFWVLFVTGTPLAVMTNLPA